MTNDDSFHSPRINVPLYRLITTAVASLSIHSFCFKPKEIPGVLPVASCSANIRRSYSTNATWLDSRLCRFVFVFACEPRPFDGSITVGPMFFAYCWLKFVPLGYRAVAVVPGEANGVYATTLSVRPSPSNTISPVGRNSVVVPPAVNGGSRKAAPTPGGKYSGS